jgi:hypothetical protein
MKDISHRSRYLRKKYGDEPRLTGHSFSFAMSITSAGVKLTTCSYCLSCRTDVRTSRTFCVEFALTRLNSFPTHMLPSAFKALLHTRSAFLRFATVHTSASSAYIEGHDPKDPALSSTPQDLTPEQRALLDSAIRVDQAGEVAANWIYTGQMFVLGHDRSISPLLQVRSSLKTKPGQA